MKQPNSPDNTQKKVRYPLVDTLRGAAVVLMVTFHFGYDVFMVGGVDTGWYYRPMPCLWQQTACCTFILLSGFVWHWGRKTALRRGIQLNLWGLAISLVMLVFMPEEPIWFGVLTFLGCALLLMLLLEPLAEIIPSWPGLVGSLLLFVLCRQLPQGYLSLGTLWHLDLPQILYDVRVLVPLGFQYPDFYSSDYFPILPWMLLYLVGFYLFRLVEGRPLWQCIGQTEVPVLTALGRRSLVIYLLHQPVCFALSLVVVRLMG